MESLEHLAYSYLQTGILGAAALYFVEKHRGKDNYDKNRNVNVADGTGISAKIIKKFPSYAKMSPSIDHLLAGFGMSMFGGFLGAMSLDFKNLEKLHTPALKPYILLAGYYIAVQALQTSFSLYRRRNNITLDDASQIMCDFLGISAGILTASRFVN